MPLTFDREDDDDEEREYPGWIFKCKCTFYLYLYANELFLPRERKTREAPASTMNATRVVLSCVFYTSGKSSRHAIPEDN